MEEWKGGFRVCCLNHRGHREHRERGKRGFLLTSNHFVSKSRITQRTMKEELAYHKPFPAGVPNLGANVLYNHQMLARP